MIKKGKYQILPNKIKLMEGKKHIYLKYFNIDLSTFLQGIKILII